MDVILPAAGLGSRLRPHTWSKPKPLVSLAGKTILDHVLDSVLPANPEKIVFITGYLGPAMEEWARANVPVPTEFVVQPQMLGQTDAIIRCRDIATGSALILFPDAVFDADFTGLAESDADVVVFTKFVDDPSQLGVVVIEDDKVVRLVEKPAELISNQAVIGIYYFKSMPALYAAIEHQMANGIKTKGEYFIADAIQIMIDNGAVVHAEMLDFWEDCGNIEALLATNKLLLDRAESGTEVRGDSLILHPSIVANDVRLERSIVGPLCQYRGGSVHPGFDRFGFNCRGRGDNFRRPSESLGHRAEGRGNRAPPYAQHWRRKSGGCVTEPVGIWYELSTTADAEAVESVAELFSRFGYNEGVSIEEPFLQEQDGDNLTIDTSRPATIRTYIPAEAYDPAIVDQIREGLWYLGRMRSVGELTVSTRNEEDWASAWKEHYRPLRASERVVIRPPWFEYQEQPDDIVLILDPGMAFGTGMHPTTKLCLTQIEQCVTPGASPDRYWYRFGHPGPHRLANGRCTHRCRRY